MRVAALLGLILASIGLQAAFAMCPDKCKCDDVNLITTCIKAGLEVMPNTLNPRVETIIYKYNNFPTVDVSLRFLTRLKTVDLSHNYIVSVTDKAFARLSNLKVLKLDGNQINKISTETFIGLHSVEVISLRGNEIAELPDQVFKNAPKVQKLNLGRNRIANVHEGAFNGLQGLKILHLEDNFLTSVPFEALRPLASLAELHMAGNPLKVLPQNAFVHFHSLHSLDLTSCRLSQVHNLALNGLGTLRHLRLGDNNLTEVPTEALRRVPNLHSLHLGRNPFEAIGTEALSPLAQLKHVDISGCSKLASIEAGAFKNCIDLKHVTISLNRALVYLDAKAFDSAMSRLNSLNLADNGLQTLPASLVPWSRLQSLDLTNNPWHCDCSLNFMAEMLAQFKSNISDNIHPGKCASPEAKRGQNLRDLQMEACSNNNNYYQENQVVLTKEQVNDENDLEVKNEVRNAFMERHEATNATAVIVSVSIVSVVIVLTLLTFIYLKWCRRHVQDWIKEYKWRRHDAALARKTTLSQPYLSGDNYIYTSPRLHHTYVYHGSPMCAGQQPGQPFLPQQQSPLVTNYPTINELANTTDAEDEYFYVSNYGPNNSSNIIIANGFGTVGKSIPVTVL